MNDLISRQDAIELAMQYCPDDDGACSKVDEDIRNLLDELENLPSAQPEQKKGKWKVDWNWCIAICTNCNHEYDDADNWYINEMRYCPFCGAKMEGEE